MKLHNQFLLHTNFGWWETCKITTKDCEGERVAQEISLAAMIRIIGVLGFLVYDFTISWEMLHERFQDFFMVKREKISQYLLKLV
jgi:hypothetical protein